MLTKFNIREGLTNVIHGLVEDGDFAEAVMNLAIGRREAADELNLMIRRASQEHTLNEIVSVHRYFKAPLDESKFGDINAKPKELLRKVNDIRKKSHEFQSAVIAKSITDPKVLAALVKAVKSRGADVPADLVLAKSLVKSAKEVAAEEDKEEIKTMLSEDVESSYGGRIPVNVYVGRFQPFHLGHLSCVKEAAKYGLRTVICPVMKGKTASAGDHPFDEAVENEMFGRLKNSQEEIADVIPVKNSFIEFWVYPLREAGYEPITWTTGEDRVPSYQAMVDKYREKYELVPNFKILALDKNVDGVDGSASNTSNISGTRVRECLMNDDKEGFVRQMPECLHDMYDKMRRALTGEEEPAYQTSGTINEDEAYAEYRKRLDEAIARLVKGERK